MALRRRGILVMSCLLALSFQFFFSVGYSFETHPLAPLLLLEATLGALIVWSTLCMVWKGRAGRLTSIDVVLYLTPFLFLLLSGLLAYLAYRQPIHFAVVEDRRVFGFLFWFAFAPVCERYRLTFEDILRALYWTALLYLGLGLLLQATMRDALSSRAIPDLDPRKLRMSSPGMCFSICWVAGFVRLLQGQRRLSWSMLLAGILGMVLIAQTRQLVIAVLVACLLSLVALRLRYALIGLAVCVVVGVVVLPLAGEEAIEAAIETVLPNIDEFSTENIGENTRTKTARIAMTALYNNYFIGLGALSLQHEEGMYRLYGKNVFINDIGLLGDTYRVGIFIVGFLWALAAVYLALWRGLHPAHRPVVGALGAWVMLLAISNGLIPLTAHVHSFLIMLMVCSVSQARPAGEPLSVRHDIATKALVPGPAPAIRGA